MTEIVTVIHGPTSYNVQLCIHNRLVSTFNTKNVQIKKVDKLHENG